MTDVQSPLDALGRLKRHLTPELDHEDVERLVRGAAERRQRRRIRRTLAVGLALGVVSTTVVVLFLRFSVSGGTIGAAPAVVLQPAPALSSSTPAPAAGRRAPEILSFRDRSRAVALDPGTELALEEDAPERVHLRLERGRARFEVTRRPERSFSVRARNVTVSVVGTTFGVEVVADRVGVSVEKGAVEVDWGVGQKRLLAGESGWFPPLVMSAQPEAPVTESARNAPAEPRTALAPASSPPSPEPGAQSLLAEVNAVRSQGKPARAVELLRQLLREYPDNPRAPLAAFTLGRVLFNELGRPREAATAFRQVRQKAPGSQFAEDALAREVEAWERASEPARARSLAAEYLERYPSGRHARRVKALTGIE